jgi:hypothetical protein
MIQTMRKENSYIQVSEKLESKKLKFDFFPSHSDSSIDIHRFFINFTGNSFVFFKYTFNTQQMLNLYFRQLYKLSRFRYFYQM